MFDSKIDRMINWLIDLIFPLLNLEMMKSNNSIRVFLHSKNTDQSTSILLNINIRLGIYFFTW